MPIAERNCGTLGKKKPRKKITQNIFKNISDFLSAQVEIEADIN